MNKWCLVLVVARLVLFECIGGGAEAECLAGAGVELVGDVVEGGLVVLGEVCAFGEVLA